jgi:hypothetical protein
MTNYQDAKGPMRGQVLGFILLLKALTRKFDCKLCLAYVTINRNALETLNFVMVGLILYVHL